VRENITTVGKLGGQGERGEGGQPPEPAGHTPSIITYITDIIMILWLPLKFVEDEPYYFDNT
jgi:hypothetical protein